MIEEDKVEEKVVEISRETAISLYDYLGCVNQGRGVIGDQPERWMLGTLIIERDKAHAVFLIRGRSWNEAWTPSGWKRLQDADGKPPHPPVAFPVRLPS